MKGKPQLYTFWYLEDRSMLIVKQDY